MLTTNLKLFISLLFLFFFSCGQNESEKESSGEEGPIDLSVKYSLERVATGLTTNYLIIKSDKRAGYLFSVSGEGFESNPPKDTILPVQDKITLTYSTETIYEVHLVIFQKDTSILVEDRLKWEYSTEQPPKAVIGFKEAATNQSSAVLLISAASRASNVKEIMIAGDYDPDKASKDDWYPIPDDGSITVPLSKEDGVKKFRIKMRNSYFNETNELNLQIIKKTSKPLNCAAIPIADTSNDEDLEFYIKADDPYELSYQVSGTGALPSRWIKFNGSTIDLISLKTGAGAKEVTVSIKDIAENYCDSITQNITIDPNYLFYGLSLSNDAVVTDQETITLTTHFDHFEHITTEMYISGHVSTDGQTFQWIPYAKTIDIPLLPSSGHRMVNISYRDARGAGAEAARYIFLRPFFIVKGTYPNLTVIPSPIYHLQDMTITGCLESYNQIPFEFSLPCTANASTIIGQYNLTNNQILTFSVLVEDL